MTACVNTETLKSFVRVDDEIENQMLELLAESATGLIETRLRRPVVGDVESGAVAATVDDVPRDIQIACCMLVAFMYENRTATDEEIRSRVMRSMFIDSYIDWSADDADESGQA
jgi:hypothetical protein